jgi:quercetin dioxygenase-like cupin family protein
MSDPVESVLSLLNIFRIDEWQEKLAWKPFASGVDIYCLYEIENGPKAALLRFHPGARVEEHEHAGYEHILVLSGHQVDENSRADAGTLIINPPGTAHSVYSESGCIVLAIYERPVRFRQETDRVLLAVNGTLMRGLELNPNLLDAGGVFVCETVTAPLYRLWSIGDRHPAMIRVGAGGVAVAVELWSVPAEGIAGLLIKEPTGLCIGKVLLSDQTEVAGVLGEPALCDGQKDISAFGGWRAYLQQRSMNVS